MRFENILTVGDNYFILRRLGTGGAASVYKAWDKVLYRYVAIKKIHENLNNDPKFVKMFLNEAVNTAKLEHGNIVRVINLIEDEDDYYIIMEFVNGIDLEFLLKQCKKFNVNIPPLIAFHIIAEIIKALDYTHNLKDETTGKPLNIVHRDISPGNIMINYDGRVKLTDFGIAKVGNSSKKDKRLMGKVSYMSPEQARSNEIDARSDLFCCGLILYELLTGEKAYNGDSTMNKWLKAKDAKIKYNKLQKKGVSKELIVYIKQLLKKDPDKRYQSATEVFNDFKKYFMKNGSFEEINNKYINFLNILSEKEKNITDTEYLRKVENQMKEEQPAHMRNLNSAKKMSPAYEESLDHEITMLLDRKPVLDSVLSPFKKIHNLL